MGLTRSRCPQDEKLVAAICQLTKNSGTVYLLDSRPIVNALANQVAGECSGPLDTKQNELKIFLCRTRNGNCGVV